MEKLSSVLLALDTCNVISSDPEQTIPITVASTIITYIHSAEALKSYERCLGILLLR